MCKFSTKSGEVPFQPLGDLTWNDPSFLYNLIDDQLWHVLVGYISNLFGVKLRHLVVV